MKEKREHQRDREGGRENQAEGRKDYRRPDLVLMLNNAPPLD